MGPNRWFPRKLDPQKSLFSRARSTPIFAVVAVLCGLLLPQLASAHHNKGLPHYGYYDNYPQVPTEEYIEIHGPWEFGATVFNFQGYQRRRSDTPNDVKIFCYLYDIKADQAYIGPARFEIRDGDELVAAFERKMVDEEAVYSTRETLPATGTYKLVAIVGGNKIASLDFYVELVDDRFNWWLAGGLGVPLLLLGGLAWYGKRRRRKPVRVDRKMPSIAGA